LLTAGVLLLAPGPVPALFPPGSPAATALAGLAVVAGLAVAVCTVVAVLARRHGSANRVARVVRAAAADVRAGLLGRHTWPGVLAGSTVVVAGHAATFVVAARAAGVTAPVTQLLPLALIVLVAMGLPLNVAGWGPREGAAAWAFGATGLGAAGGVGTAVAYGVIVLVASLPGAAVLAVARRERRRSGRPESADGAARG
ncbi:MAG TPA: UPF0104 family protein, partial [Lapillicoccus sp.]|nr:UPF0104 family protein [Lapillicoccus sp.]